MKYNAKLVGLFVEQKAVDQGNAYFPFEKGR